MKIDLAKYDQSNYSRGRSGIIILIWWIIQGTVFRFSLHNMYSWRRLLLKAFGAKIGRNVKVRASAKFTYPWNISIGENSWIGDDVVLYSLDKIDIEENCVISQKSYLCTGSHNINSPKFELEVRPIKVEKGVWIASDVFVAPGLVIEKYSVVAARSTVTQDLDSFGIYMGTPAKYMKRRNIDGDEK